jgi:hypothetical protein
VASPGGRSDNVNEADLGAQRTLAIHDDFPGRTGCGCNLVQAAVLLAWKAYVARRLVPQFPGQDLVDLGHHKQGSLAIEPFARPLKRITMAGSSFSHVLGTTGTLEVSAEVVKVAWPFRARGWGRYLPFLLLPLPVQCPVRLL